jgi:DUF4097 and DUF4098 domain-containing protein YvlB
MFDETPGQANLTLQNKQGSSIKIEMASGKIALQHPIGSQVTLNADGTVSINAFGNLDLKSTTGDINLTATNVKVKVIGTMDVS